MSVYTTDQQQMDQFHQWWKNNGTSTIVIFIVALSLSFGWRFWLQHQETVLTQASANYEQLLNNVVNNNNTGAIQVANTLMQDYSHTPYAPLAALMLARQFVYQGNYTDAENQLVWVMHHAHNKAIRQIARLRAARVLLAQNQPQQALLMLSKIDDNAYQPVIDEITGDCFVALGQFDRASQSYQQATTILPGYDVAQPILRMKLDNLSVANNSTSDAGNTAQTTTTHTDVGITSQTTTTPTDAGNTSQTTTGASHE